MNSNNNIIKRTDDISDNEKTNKIRLIDEVNVEDVDFKEDCYIFVYQNITINFLKEIIEYNEKYKGNLGMALQLYKDDTSYRILINNKDKYKIKISNNIYIVVDKSKEEATGEDTDSDNPEEKMINDFLKIVTQFIKYLVRYINNNKSFECVNNYVRIYSLYGDLISIVPNTSITKLINLNILPYINYFIYSTYFNVINLRNNKNIFYVFNLHKRNGYNYNIDAKVLYSLLSDILIEGKNFTYICEKKSDPYESNRLEDKTNESIKLILSVKDIIIYSIDLIGADDIFAYLIEIIKSFDFNINDIVRIEIAKLRALLKVHIYMPDMIQIAMNNIHLAYFIESIPLNKLNFFSFIFKAYMKLESQLPSVSIFLKLLSSFENEGEIFGTTNFDIPSNELGIDNCYSRAFLIIDKLRRSDKVSRNDFFQKDDDDDSAFFEEDQSINFNKFNEILKEDDEEEKQFNDIDFDICRNMLGNDLNWEEPVLKLLDFIKYNRGCTRIFYEVHTVNDLKLSNNENYIFDNINEFNIIPVLGEYCFHFGHKRERNAEETTNEKYGGADKIYRGNQVEYQYLVPIRYCSITQIEKEINELRKQLSDHFEIVVILYTDKLDRRGKSLRFKYQHLNFMVHANDNNNNISEFIETKYNGIRKLIIPIKKLSEKFLTETPEEYKDIFEEYNDLKAKNIADLNFSCNYTDIKRIEIVIKKSSEYINLGGYYLPLKIKNDETNMVLEGIVNKMQLSSIYSQFNAPLCCFVWSIVNTPNINDFLTEEEIERIKLNYGKSYIGRNEIKEFCNEFNINVEIKRFGYINGGERINTKKISIRSENNTDKKITIGFIKYGVHTHYFPIFPTEITKFCCKKLDLSKEEYYNIDASGDAKIENYKIIEGVPRTNKELNKKVFADSFTLLKALIMQNKLEWASNFDNELFNYGVYKLNPDLNLIQKYGVIMTEEIHSKEKDYKKFNYICAADTETYTEENRLIPFCICCSFKRNDKLFSRSFYGVQCQNDFLRYLCSNKINRVYFHNLKFDGWLFKNFMIRDMVYHASKLYSLKILFKFNNKDNIIELYDSLALIPSALRNFPKMFNLDKMEKELYPYNLINKESVERGYLEEEEIRNYFKEEYEEFRKQYNKNINNVSVNKYDIKKLTIYYCQNDVDLLLNGLIIFEKMGIQLFGNVSPLRFLTISSYSYNIMVRNCFDKLNKYKGDIKNYIRRSIRGGRCMVSNNEKVKAEGEIVDFDACSLYPSAMHRLLLPTGDCYCSTDVEEVKRLFEENLMDENQLEANNNKYISYMILNVKILKINKTRNFPLLSYQTKGINLYTNEMIGKEVYLTSIELEDFLLYQEGEVEFLNAIYWKGNKDNRMSQYIAKCYNLRKEYKKQGNPLQEVLKLFMNSSYGKTIQKDVKEEYKFVSPEKAESYLRNNYGRIKEIIELNPSTSWIKLEGSSKPLAVPCHIGALILGMSKRIMNEVMCLAEDNNIPLYYQDTDSMHLRKEDVSVLENLFYNKFNRKLIGSDMGQFHIDFPLVDGKEPVSRKSIFLGKKAYLDCLKNEDGKEDYFIRMKGVPDDVIINTCKDMNITVEELYERMYIGNEIDFNLLNSNKPKFEFTKDFQIMIKEKFSRKVKF